MRMRHFLRCAVVFLLFGLAFADAPWSFAAFEAKAADGALLEMEAEILEVETLKDPFGSAIYTVKDLASGKTERLYADRYRTLVHIGGSPKEVADVLGGEKATIIYRRPNPSEMPEIVFARVSNTYYG